MKWMDKIKDFLDWYPEKLFYPGQEITPTAKCYWWSIENGTPVNGPKFGEIVQCVKYAYCLKGKWYIKITGYEGNFEEQWFAPVISDEHLEEMLNEIDELMIKQQEPIG